MKTLSVIIPCYNEQATITSILDRMQQVQIPNWNLETIVVDDGSTDNTRNILKGYESKVKVIYNPKNQGKGYTVRTGLEAARGDYMMIQDADLEYDPMEIPNLVEALEKTGDDVIYGSRNIHRVKRSDSYVTRLGTWITTKEFNILYGARLTDLWTCYKIFPREAAPLYVAGGFESDIIFSARVAKNGFTASDVPISYNPRTSKEGKKIRYRDGVNGLWLLLKERFSRTNVMPAIPEK
ncbi:MAG: glycosyltransferase family 2 protein [Patescibacteria group bacterium]